MNGSVYPMPEKPSFRQWLRTASKDDITTELVLSEELLSGLRGKVEKLDAKAKSLEAENAHLRALLMAEGRFERRVDLLQVDPSKGVHYTGGSEGPYPYYPEFPSPPGIYPVIIVPKDLVGKVVWVGESKDVSEQVRNATPVERRARSE